MEENLKILNEFSECELSIIYFYSASVTASGVCLQGYKSPELIEDIEALKFVRLDPHPDGYIEFKRGIINITLT